MVAGENTLYVWLNRVPFAMANKVSLTVEKFSVTRIRRSPFNDQAKNIIFIIERSSFNIGRELKVLLYKTNGK